MARPTVTTKYVNSGDSKKVEIKSKWWDQPKTQMYQHVIGVVNAIEQQQSYRRRKNMQSARLYSNSNFQSLYGVGFQFPTTANNNTNNRVTLNVIKACCDTAAAKISKNRPKPMFLTEKGDRNQQNRAKKLTKYIEGVFDTIDIYDRGQEVFRDAEVFGTGALKFIKDEDAGCVRVERVMIDEIKVDDNDGMYGSPRQMFQTKYIHRSVLMDMFPEKKEKIRQATGGIEGQTKSQSSADMIQTVEAWHLPSGPDANDGKHCICIDECNLFEEDYDRDYFPFIFLKWSKPILGFYGTGIPEELRGIQIEINKLLQNIQISQHLMSHPKWFVENSSGVNAQHLTNDNGGIINFSDVMPQAFVPPAMSNEVYQHLENLYRKAFEITGVTQLSATGKKPEGLDSGVAIREYNDIESERFIIIGQQYEQFFMDAAKMIINLSKEMYEEGKDLSVNVKGKRFIKTIQWSEVDLEDDKFVMSVYPVSQLPNTPAGKLQFVQELIQAGLVDTQYALDLLDFPDMDAYIDSKTASLEILKEMVQKMIDDEDYYAVPEPFMDLQYNIEYTQRAYLQAKMDNVPNEALEKLRRFMDQNKSMLEAAKRALMQQQQETIMAQQTPLPSAQ